MITRPSHPVKVTTLTNTNTQHTTHALCLLIFITFFVSTPCVPSILLSHATRRRLAHFTIEHMLGRTRHPDLTLLILP